MRRPGAKPAGGAHLEPLRGQLPAPVAAARSGRTLWLGRGGAGGWAAGGALFFSLRKNKTIVETYTQFKKRSDSNSSKVEMHHASIPSLILRGYDTKGNKVKLVINSQTLSGGKANIGRDKHSCSFSIDDQTVSRIHACLELIAGRLTIKDLGSTNGTSVNGVPVGSQPVRIHPGQKLSIGKVILTLDGEIS